MTFYLNIFRVAKKRYKTKRFVFCTISRMKLFVIVENNWWRQTIWKNQWHQVKNQRYCHRSDLIKNHHIEICEDGTRKKWALLDVLLKSSIDGQPLSDEDIQEEVDTFMFEGHDTTTSAISFTLHLLSQHKEVQDRVLAEIVQVFGADRNAEVTYRLVFFMLRRYLNISLTLPS